MRFRALFLENRSLKLTAILLAFILWLMVRGDPNAERVISVPLEVRIPRNMEITSERPISVDVTVRGSFPNMWFAPNLPTYIIDLQSFGEGKLPIQLSPENVRFPRASGLEAIAVRPARLSITLERTIANEVPIKVPPLGEPGPGIEVYGVSLSPRTLVISGPRSRIEHIKEIKTEAISLAGQRQSLRRFVNLDVPDDLVHTNPAGPVEVNIQLGTARTMRKVAAIPVEPDDRNFSVSPNVVSIQVQVPITYEKPLTAGDFVATVTVSSVNPALKNAKVRPEVRLRDPADPAIVIKNIQPPEITVQRLKKK